MAKKKKASMAQIAHREISWLLYITEGYAANAQHALTVNSYTLDHSTLHVMEQAVLAAADTAALLRIRMAELAKENA
jgi:hypothetical protein